MNWIWSNLDRIGELVLVHLALSVPAITLSFVLSVPIGWLAWRFRWSRGVLLSLCGILYAIPSLPLLIALPGLIGVSLRSPVNLVVALTLYGMALMVRTAADAFADVDADIRLSATAIGYSPWRRFAGVELPLAGPGLLAGLRVVIVSTMSLATISALIGVQSLGSLFTDGFQRGIAGEIWAGVIATMLLAIALDWVVVLLGRWLLPWNLRARGPRRMRRRPGGAQPEVAA
ncbi:ABC transporter permease [Agromyces aerolatus]|uniref:ABC transporter permease n=1 Tax=Agromyces sp. LY-1074 TaxID=3074080 RepID=UPI0028675463|nr:MULTISPECIES: ABC transporter permease subunit [unclassified Agromyces]MDR5700751.1 ABC transporter permease subunit [Agromyces sp. LY-1074]MDR5707272.1 ABC transporter permease subunit [Agromyces sp. LY-1358]